MTPGNGDTNECRMLGEEKENENGNPAKWPCGKVTEGTDR